MGDKGQMPIEEVFSECGSTPKDAISGAKYVPPAAEVMIFALEKGFATSVTLGVSSNGASEHNNTPQPFTTNDSWSTHGWD